MKGGSYSEKSFGAIAYSGVCIRYCRDGGCRHIIGVGVSVSVPTPATGNTEDMPI